MGMETLLRELGVTPGQAMIVGDSEIDIKTARNSGVWACGVSYGLGPEGLRTLPPDLMLDSLAELPAYLNGHTK
jgi:phosphoglycolate phosphatase